MSRNFKRALVAAFASVAIVLGSLMVVDQLVPARDQTVRYCVWDQNSGLYYCSKTPVTPTPVEQR